MTAKRFKKWKSLSESDSSDSHDTSDNSSSDDCDSENEDGMLDFIDTAKDNLADETYSQDELLKEFRHVYKKALTDIVLPLHHSSYHNELIDKIILMKDKYKDEETAINKVIKKNSQLFE